MIPGPTKIRFSFRAKVLVPVVVIMVLLMSISMWLAYRRVYNQLQNEARVQLNQSGRSFNYLQELHGNELEWRYRNIVNEPKFKAVARLTEPRTANPPGSVPQPLDPSVKNTFVSYLNDLISDKVAEAITLTTSDGQHLTASRAPELPAREFEEHCADSINLVREGMTRKSDLALYGGKLFDILSLPIVVDGDRRGVISFGVPNAVENDFHELTHSELIVCADDRIVAYKLANPEIKLADLQQELTAKIPAAISQLDQPIKPLNLFNERYLYLTVTLNEANSPLHYLVLFPIENAMQALEQTQRQIFLVSLIAILIGTIVVSLIVRKVTRPLEELRDTAEAVGRGDFSRRVEVRSRDECGELAQVFNRMTENLTTTQAQLIQSEKLSAIGEFVAGVAHELNNPLTTVMGFSELLQHDGLNGKQKEFVAMIHKNAQRCQRIVLSLLSFARRHQPERKPVCVNQLIEGAQDILGYQLRTNNIKVTCQLEPDLLPVMGDSHQLQQVLVNILNNARQAIEAHRPEGWIKITTQTVGPNVRITIQDSGPGISAENLSKLFDPFFTTKEVGKGTGLGLSLCYGIIKEHGGNITPSSQPGAGATFTIELPITHETAAPVAAVVSDETKAQPEGTGKRVLVIDDEENILAMVREVLLRQGYEVETVPDGALALKLLRQNDYDIVLCDWKMPGLSGRMVYDRLRVFKPALAERMVFITGDLVSEPTRQFLESEKKACLAKPFTLAEFRAAIQQVLPR